MKADVVPPPSTAMSSVAVSSVAGAEPAALIKEARRRQLRRRLVVCAAVTVVLAGVLGSYAALRGRPPGADTGCASEGTSLYLSYGGNYGFSACRFMRVYDVVTGRLRSFAAPPGTIGWIPSHGGYWSASAIAPSVR